MFPHLLVHIRHQTAPRHRLRHLVIVINSVIIHIVNIKRLVNAFILLLVITLILYRRNQRHKHILIVYLTMQQISSHRLRQIEQRPDSMMACHLLLATRQCHTISIIKHIYILYRTKWQSKLFDSLIVQATDIIIQLFLQFKVVATTHHQWKSEIPLVYKRQQKMFGRNKHIAHLLAQFYSPRISPIHLESHLGYIVHKQLFLFNFKF